MAYDHADYESDFETVTVKFNTVSPDQFNPSLNALDNLVQSISINMEAKK